MGTQFDLLPEITTADMEDKYKLFHWLHRVWLKLKDDYNSSRDMTLIMTTMGVSSIKNEPEVTTVVDNTVQSVFTHEFSGMANDIEAKVKKVEVREKMDNSLDVGDIIKSQHNIQIMMVMGGY